MPYYRFATSPGLVKKPAISVNKANGTFLGFENYCLLTLMIQKAQRLSIDFER
jgi:hypothetical protein